MDQGPTTESLQLAAAKCKPRVMKLKAESDKLQALPLDHFDRVSKIGPCQSRSLGRRTWNMGHATRLVNKMSIGNLQVGQAKESY